MIRALIDKRSKAWFAHFLVSSHGVSYLPELEQPRPPDAPPGMVKPRLVEKY
jgi:hypothetical protein